MEFFKQDNHQIHIDDAGKPIKMWINGVPLEPQAFEQLKNISQLPFIHKHIAVMPDVHLGCGATVGSVIPTKGAIIPAAVGVDIGCGMMAVKTNLIAEDLPNALRNLRNMIEKAVPHGFESEFKNHLKGSFRGIPREFERKIKMLELGYNSIIQKHPKLAKMKAKPFHQIGTLGGGNHFVEICLDERNNVWVMLHSGSRGIGNCIGRYFIDLAKKDMERHFINLPDKDLSYLTEGTKYFEDYVEAVDWAQKFAKINRECMMESTIKALSKFLNREIKHDSFAVNCHHNYIDLSQKFGEGVYITRKGAVSADNGELGIIPGSMGTKSYIVEGKGNKDSFNSCSHGAGRVMSRTAAKKKISLEAHQEALAGVECKADKSTLDESPASYKDIDKVMAAQEDLVEIKATLKQILCVKG